MLWFIGLGISGISELSENTRNIIKNAEIVYLESFTSPISEDEKEQLQNICNGNFLFNIITIHVNWDSYI